MFVEANYNEQLGFAKYYNFLNGNRNGAIDI
jgi:hypothetical protein